MPDEDNDEDQNSALARALVRQAKISALPDSTLIYCFQLLSDSRILLETINLADVIAEMKKRGLPEAQSQ